MQDIDLQTTDEYEMLQTAMSEFMENDNDSAVPIMRALSKLCKFMSNNVQCLPRYGWGNEPRERTVEIEETFSKYADDYKEKAKTLNGTEYSAKIWGYKKLSDYINSELDELYIICHTYNIKITKCHIVKTKRVVRNQSTNVIKQNKTNGKNIYV